MDASEVTQSLTGGTAIPSLPTSFADGRTDYVDDGGVFKPENAAFSATGTGPIVWTLGNRTATAGTDSPRCPEPTPVTVKPILECVVVTDNGITGYFGYLNETGRTVDATEITQSLTGGTATPGCLPPSPTDAPTTSTTPARSSPETRVLRHRHRPHRLDARRAAPQPPAPTAPVAPRRQDNPTVRAPEGLHGAGRDVLG